MGVDMGGCGEWYLRIAGSTRGVVLDIARMTLAASVAMRQSVTSLPEERLDDQARSAAGGTVDALRWMQAQDDVLEVRVMTGEARGLALP